MEHGTGKIGTAIMVSDCATMCGFSALLFAEFPIIQDFGLVTVLAMAFTLFGALVAVPALVSLLLKNSGKSTMDAGKSSPPSDFFRKTASDGRHLSFFILFCSCDATEWFCVDIFPPI